MVLSKHSNRKRKLGVIHERNNVCDMKRKRTEKGGELKEMPGLSDLKPLIIVCVLSESDGAQYCGSK